MLSIVYKTNNNHWVSVDSFDQISNDAIEIDCRFNNLTNNMLPDFEHFTKLRIIDCSENKLTKLPEWKYLINLEEINCNYNKLVNFPISWTNIEYINYKIENNYLDSNIENN